eukprot:XP_015575326.1 uncharacterized protein LOC107261325 [Ricinus communis]
MCLAMIWAIRNLRHYFQCYKVQEIQKIDLLKYLFEALSLTGKPARWLVLLAEFEIEYITKNVITSRAVAEFLAQNAIEGDDLWDLEFPDENLGVIEIQEWKMYFDGVENAKGAGLGVIMIMLEGDMPRISKQFDFKVTNNIAEYESCLFGLKAVVGGGARQLMVYGDSMLVIQQAIEESNVKEERLKPYVNYLRTLVCNFSKCSFIHFLLDENHMVDLLVTVSSMWDKPSQLPMKPLQQPAEGSGNRGSVSGISNADEVPMSKYTKLRPIEFDGASEDPLDLLDEVEKRASDLHYFDKRTIEMASFSMKRIASQ